MSNKIVDSGTKTSTFTTKLGNIVGAVLVGCLAVCLMAICVALTYRFVVWLL